VFSPFLENGFVRSTWDFVETCNVKSATTRTESTVVQIACDMAVVRTQNVEPCKKTARRGRQIPEAGGRLRQYRLLSGGEGEGQKTGAEQHEAGCGQGQEAVGNKVMMAHVTSSFSDARPNCLKLSERA
jgi:hypothetical protein